jgi:hypothetical protein
LWFSNRTTSVLHVAVLDPFNLENIKLILEWETRLAYKKWTSPKATTKSEQVRGQQLTQIEWQACFDEQRRIKNLKEIRQKVFWFVLEIEWHYYFNLR